MAITTVGTIQGQTGDMLVVGTVVALLWTPARGSANPPIYSPGDFCWKPDTGVRRLSEDRGGSLGPGNPSTNPTDSAGTGATASWQVVDLAALQASPDTELIARVTRLESERSKSLDLTGRNGLPASAINSVSRIDRSVTLPRAEFTGISQYIDILSDATTSLSFSGESGVTVADETGDSPGGFATAVLVATNSWRVIGAI